MTPLTSRHRSERKTRLEQIHKKCWTSTKTLERKRKHLHLTDGIRTRDELVQEASDSSRVLEHLHFCLGEARGRRTKPDQSIENPSAIINSVTFSRQRWKEKYYLQKLHCDYKEEPDSQRKIV